MKRLWLLLVAVLLLGAFGWLASQERQVSQTPPVVRLPDSTYRITCYLVVQTGQLECASWGTR